MTLAARALAIGFGSRAIASGIDVTLAPGEAACLLGPNGSGKTTLMRTLLALQPPLAGTIELDGRALDAWSARERARRLAYVPQSAAGDFDFTVLEAVEMGRTAARGPFSGPGRHDRERAHACLERLGIARLAARSVRQLSGGERQLVLIARALATEATCLLLDEPTASLDFANQALILDEIARLARAGCAVLFTTHHPDHALRVAHRAILLRGGALLASGPAAAMLNSENLSALYGRPVEVAQLPSPGGGTDRFCIVRESPRFD